MTHQQRAAFKTSGIRDPGRFLRTINRRADKTREPFSITKIQLDFWNVFDFVVVVVCYLPLGANMVAVIRLFRLLRVLKLVKALPELQVWLMPLFELVKRSCKVRITGSNLPPFDHTPLPTHSMRYACSRRFLSRVFSPP